VNNRTGSRSRDDDGCPVTCLAPAPGSRLRDDPASVRARSAPGEMKSLKLDLWYVSPGGFLQSTRTSPNRILTDSLAVAAALVEGKANSPCGAASRRRPRDHGKRTEIRPGGGGEVRSRRRGPRSTIPRSLRRRPSADSLTRFPPDRGTDAIAIELEDSRLLHGLHVGGEGPGLRALPWIKVVARRRVERNELFQ